MISGAQNIFSILQEAGANPQQRGNYYQCAAKFRNGDSATSCVIYPDTQLCKDFVTGKTYKLEDFLKLFTDKNFELGNFDLTPKLDVFDIPRVYELDLLEKLIPDHSYWIKRGIRKEVVKFFRGGVCKTGKYQSRYVIPVLNYLGTKITGFAGRDLLPEQKDAPFPRPKWKLSSGKSNWTTENLTGKYILETKTVLLIESYGDQMSLWSKGDIKNTLNLFGIELLQGNLWSILKLDPDRIIIATNNDSGGSRAGNKNAWKIRRKLSNYFDDKQIIIGLPDKNDFGVMNESEILSYKEKYKL